MGYGMHLPIAELGAEVKPAVGYVGSVDFDISKPDSAPRKMMVAGASAGLEAAVHLRHGWGWRTRTPWRTTVAT